MPINMKFHHSSDKTAVIPNTHLPPLSTLGMDFLWNWCRKIIQACFHRCNAMQTPTTHMCKFVYVKGFLLSNRPTSFMSKTAAEEHDHARTHFAKTLFPDSSISTNQLLKSATDLSVMFWMTDGDPWDSSMRVFCIALTELYFVLKLMFLTEFILPPPIETHFQVKWTLPSV